MTNFDQLIKEKINQKQYSYTASAWHSFAKKAGLKTSLTIWQSIVIGVVAASVVAIVSYLGVRFAAENSKQLAPTEAPIVHQPAITVDTFIVAAPDTLLTAPPADTMPKISTNKGTITTGPTIATAVAEEPITMPITDTVQEEKVIKKVILRPKKPRRILEINTDTILSND